MFVLIEGECSFVIGTEIIALKAPAVVRVPPHTPHSPTTLGSGRNVMVDFFPSSKPSAAPVDAPDPFAFPKRNADERQAMMDNFKKILTDFDADGDGFISMKDAQSWN